MWYCFGNKNILRAKIQGSVDTIKRFGRFERGYIVRASMRYEKG